jgi:hypothetical protein
MKSKKPFSPLADNHFTKAVLGCAFATGILISLMLAQKSWSGAVQILCGFYAFATGLFFLAQLYGFVISQTQYSDHIEAPKFAMLDQEEAEWKS